MDINHDGQINKYELAVFFLNVAQYEDLVIEKDIEKHTGFYAPINWRFQRGFSFKYKWYILKLLDL